MSQIWKYDLDLAAADRGIEMPVGAKFLDAQAQHGRVVAWFLVSPGAHMESRRFGAHMESRRFEIVGTGVPFEKAGLYRATVQIGALVWHVFEVQS